MYPMALWMADPTHLRIYADAIHSVMTGQPAVEKTFGVPVFEYFPRNPELSEIFNDAMTSFSAMVVPAVLESYDFSGIRTLVDVAGGHGGVLTAVLQKHPAMQGVLFDLEHVIAGAGPRIAELGLADRCRTVAGNFFEAVPEGGDAYVMKHIIHDWDDERALLILREHPQSDEPRRAGDPDRVGGAAGQPAGLRQDHRPRDAAAAGRPRTHGSRVPGTVCCRRARNDSDRAERVAAERHRGAMIEGAGVTPERDSTGAVY